MGRLNAPTPTDALAGFRESRKKAQGRMGKRKKVWGKEGKGE